MTPLFAMLRYFVASYMVGLGVGVALGYLVRMMRNVTNAGD